MSRIDSNSRAALQGASGRVGLSALDDKKTPQRTNAGFGEDAKKTPASAKTVQDSRQRGVMGEAGMKAKLEAALTEGIAGGMGADMERALREAEAEQQPPKVKQPPPAPTPLPETQAPPASNDPYSERQRIAMGNIIETGKLDMGAVDVVEPNERKTADGKTLSADSVVLPMDAGTAEMIVIRDPNGEFYKKMGNNPAVRMTDKEVDKLKANLKENHHPDKIDNPMDKNTRYNVMWNKMFPKDQVETEGH